MLKIKLSVGPREGLQETKFLFSTSFSRWQHKISPCRYR